MLFEPLFALLAGAEISSGPALPEDTPTWAPILFAAGAFVVMVLVLVLMWRKLKASERWRKDQDDDGDPR